MYHEIELYELNENLDKCLNHVWRVNLTDMLIFQAIDVLAWFKFTSVGQMIVL